MSDFDEGEREARLGCRHLLHRSCYDYLLGSVDAGRTPPCPTCRGTQPVVATYEFRGVDNFDFAEEQVMAATKQLDALNKDIEEKEKVIDQKTREIESTNMNTEYFEIMVDHKKKEVRYLKEQKTRISAPLLPSCSTHRHFAQMHDSFQTRYK